VHERAAGMARSLLEAIAKAPSAPAPAEADGQTRVLVPADPAELQAWYFERGWSDGFPVIAPTPDAVARMAAGARRPATDVVGAVPPRGGIATIECIAVNAVMAGCRPEHMPVLVTALEALLEPRFNLASIQATTHPVAPLLVVHGPIAQALKMNHGAGTFGPSSLANATLGRAIRLILWNIGGAMPGNVDRSTQGAPSKYSFCIAENAEASPWGSFVTDRGLPDGTDAVTVFGGEPPHNVNDHEHGDAEGILTVAADVLRSMGANQWFLSWYGQREVMLVLGPEHAASVAASGWSRRRAQAFLFDAISRRHDELSRGGMYGMRDWPPELRSLPMDARVPPVPRPEDILILVAGGPGKHSAALPSFGPTVSVTRAIASR
jgi:hypothetical protein